MSLVAYGASDESETSDVEDSEVSRAIKSTHDKEERAFADDGKISDEDDYVPTLGSQDAASSSTKTTTRFQSFHAPTTLSDLPAPKAVASTSSQGNIQEAGEDELEELVKPKQSQVADAPKPPPKKSKQPTRIVIPALNQADSDEEEENSKKKSRKAAATPGKGSGLFALLPPPSNETRKQTNRPLIPYTLTKRPAPSKPNKPAGKLTPSSATSTSSLKTAQADPLPSQKHQSAFNALTGYESDSDEEEGGAIAGGDLNFFSLGGEEAGGVPTSSAVNNSTPSSEIRISDSGDTSSEKTVVQPSSSSLSSSSRPDQAPVTVSDSPVSSSTSVSLSAGGESLAAETSPPQDINEDSGSNDENEVTSTVGMPQMDQDAPLTFSSSVGGRVWSAAPLVSAMVPEMYAASSSTNSSAHYWQQQQHYAQALAADTDQDTVQDVESEPGSSGGGNIQEFMEDEQFLRMSGKRKRGQESIQIIDAAVDDYVDPSDLMKGISEEQSYQPHRKKDNMPSTQQRRKKQITYLAFQAKERELELKQAWSQSRTTKNQTRSKYGF